MDYFFWKNKHTGSTQASGNGREFCKRLREHLRTSGYSHSPRTTGIGACRCFPVQASANNVGGRSQWCILPCTATLHPEPQSTLARPRLLACPTLIRPLFIPLFVPGPFVLSLVRPPTARLIPTARPRGHLPLKLYTVRNVKGTKKEKKKGQNNKKEREAT